MKVDSHWKGLYVLTGERQHTGRAENTSLLPTREDDTHSVGLNYWHTSMLILSTVQSCFCFFNYLTRALRVYRISNLLHPVWLIYYPTCDRHLKYNYQIKITMCDKGVRREWKGMCDKDKGKTKLVLLS